MHWNFVIITKNDSNNWISRSLPKFEKIIWTWLKFWTPTLLKPTYLSLPWSEFKYFSAHHTENFLNFLELTQLLSLCQFWRSLWAFKQNRPCYLSYFVEHIRAYYSVFPAKWTEEWGCCELNLEVLRSLRCSICPQDWAQRTCVIFVRLFWWIDHSRFFGAQWADFGAWYLIWKLFMRGTTFINRSPRSEAVKRLKIAKNTPLVLGSSN